MKLQTIYTESVYVNNKNMGDHIQALTHIFKTSNDRDKLVVTYTGVNKVGINPASTYETPLGIYFYQLKYVVSHYMNGGDVPFAGDQKYINICQITDMSKILHMTKFNGRHDGLELIKDRFENLDQAMSDIEQEYDIRSNYSMLWLLTMKLANGNIVKWNNILRSINIMGFIDHDTGTIHENEPSQGIVFQSSMLKVLQTIERNDNIDLRKDPINISKVPNPTERQQLLAVKANPKAIAHIQNPTPAAQKLAMLKDNNIIWMIKNPTLEILLMAIRRNPDMITSISPQNALQVVKNLTDNELSYLDADLIKRMIIKGSNWGGRFYDQNDYLAATLDTISQRRGVDCIKSLTSRMIYEILIHSNVSNIERVVNMLGKESMEKLTNDQIIAFLDDKPRMVPEFMKAYPNFQLPDSLTRYRNTH